VNKSIDYLAFSNDLLANQDLELLIEGVYYKALIYSHQNKYDEVLNELEKIIYLPNLKDQYLSGNIYYLLVLGNFLKLQVDKAEVWAKKAIEAGQIKSSLMLLMANYYFSIYMNDKAYEYYLKTLELIDKKNAFVPWLVIVNSKSFEEKLHVEKHAALAGIANYYELNGYIDKAIEFYRKALQLDEQSFSSNLSLAIIYASLGDSNMMKSYLSQGIEFFEPDNPTHQILVSTLIVNDNFRNKYLRDEMLEALVDKKVIHRYMYRQAKKIKFTGAEQELEELLVLICKEDIKQVFNILLGKIPYNSNDRLIQLNSRYSRVVLDNHSGILSRDEYERELNKIIQAMIVFIREELEKVKL
jgi:tetratricopeptide (TPR) repeat protein